MLARVLLWTLSPDKLETTPVWHAFGLPLKDGGGEFAPSMEGDASCDREQMRRGTMARTALLLVGGMGGRLLLAVSRIGICSAWRQAASKQVADVKVDLANGGWDFQAAHTDARPVPSRRLAAQRRHTLFDWGTDTPLPLASTLLGRGS